MFSKVIIISLPFPLKKIIIGGGRNYAVEWIVPFLCISSMNIQRNKAIFKEIRSS